MTPSKQEQIRRFLRQLAENHATMIELMEQMLAVICEEAATDPLAYWDSLKSKANHPKRHGLVLDRSRLTVTFRGRTCFLGNTLPFKLLSRLAQNPNAYVSHQALLDEVWQGTVSTEAIRSVVKTLRGKLRQQRLDQLAEAIDGKIRGHYALRLGAN